MIEDIKFHALHKKMDHQYPYLAMYSHVEYDLIGWQDYDFYCYGDADELYCNMNELVTKTLPYLLCDPTSSMDVYEMYISLEDEPYVLSILEY